MCRRRPAAGRQRLGSNKVLRLPEPMLARSGRIPTGPGWLFEPKMDGSAALHARTGVSAPLGVTRLWPEHEREQEMVARPDS